MTKLLIGMLFAALGATSVYAASDCAGMAAEKKLAGAAKNSFMKKCQADQGAAPGGSGCAAAANEKKLAGAARSSFMKKCEADAGGTSQAPSPDAACNAAAAEKKLAGAAKTSFVKKCIADGGK